MANNSTTTAICTSFKTELMEAGHCLAATQSGVSATGVNTQFTLTSIASTALIAVGMAATGTNVAAGAVVASVDSASQVTLSKAHTGSVSSVTFTADVLKLALVTSTASGIAYGAATTNIGTPGAGTPSNANLGTDEVSGTGYTSGGVALTNVNVVNTNPTTSAAWTFSGTAQWTGATISTIGCIIYNTTTRLGAAATPLNGRTLSVHDFGGTQSVTSGTLTLTPPTQDGTTGLIRIN